jgi:hypothetical protein
LRDPSTRLLGAEEALALSPDLAAVLIDCVAGGASVSFMAPLGREKAEAYWRDVAAGVGRGERALVVAEAEGALAGTAQVVLAQPENQPHRADVSKVLVSRLPPPRHRGGADAGGGRGGAGGRQEPPRPRHREPGGRAALPARGLAGRRDRSGLCPAPRRASLRHHVSLQGPVLIGIFGRAWPRCNTPEVHCAALAAVQK